MRMFILFTLLMFNACASVPRNKFTDKNFRVMIDPDSIDAKNYVRIQTALIKSKKFVVIDRASGFKAMKKEQDRLHKTNPTRFRNREKWAHWGEMYGVGGIVVAHIQCTIGKSLFGGNLNNCLHFLSIVDANTGVVIAAVEESSYSKLSYTMAPSWEDTVEELLEEYPTHFEPNRDHENLIYYRALSKEKALRTTGG